MGRMLASLEVRFRQHCQFLTSVFRVKNNFFEKESIEAKETAINFESQDLKKRVIMKRFLWQFSRSGCHKQTLAY
jgi:hypothetical protein